MRAIKFKWLQMKIHHFQTGFRRCCGYMYRPTGRRPSRLTPAQCSAFAKYAYKRTRTKSVREHAVREHSLHTLAADERTQRTGSRTARSRTAWLEPKSLTSRHRSPPDRRWAAPTGYQQAANTLTTPYAAQRLRLPPIFASQSAPPAKPRRARTQTNVFANSLFANTAPDPLAPRTNTTHTNEQVFANSVREL